MLKNHRLFTATNFIIVITFIMYIIQINITNGDIYFGLNIYFIKYNVWWQPISTIFAHGGLFHLILNMFVLYKFGNFIEELYGKVVFLLFYLLGGILVSLLSFIFMDYFNFNHNLVGSSGVICLLLGYVALIDPSQRKALIVWVLLVSFAPILIGFPIAWYAHIIGFVLGLLLGVCVTVLDRRN